MSHYLGLIRYIQIFIFRCNNVLYVRGVEEEDEEGEMKD